MKISDGFWLNKPGYDVSYATQMYDIEADSNSVTVYATDKWIENRGMTLGGPMLTVKFTSTLENSIKVTIDHFKGAVKKSPSFDIFEDSSFKPEINKLEDGGYELISGSTKVVIGEEKNGWNVSYWYEDKLLTKSGWRTTSFIQEQEWLTENRRLSQAGTRFFAQSDSGETSFIREMLNISVGEYIYGFGEKFEQRRRNLLGAELQVDTVLRIVEELRSFRQPPGESDFRGGERDCLKDGIFRTGRASGVFPLRRKQCG